LRHRLTLIRIMQTMGVTSLFLCVFCMLLLFLLWLTVAKVVFLLSLVLLMCSLAFSLWEIQISVHAINLHLSDIEER
jgi:hypothetical protein